MGWVMVASKGLLRGVLPCPLTVEAHLALRGAPQLHILTMAKLHFACAEKFLSQPWWAASCLVGNKLQILRNKPPTASWSPITCLG